MPHPPNPITNLQDRLGSHNLKHQSKTTEASGPTDIRPESIGHVVSVTIISVEVEAGIYKV
jgi:hypothetical protein